MTGGLLPNLEQTINKVKDFLKTHNISNFKSYFEVSFYANKEVIKMQELVGFLKSPGMNLTP